MEERIVIYEYLIITLFNYKHTHETYLKYILKVIQPCHSFIKKLKEKYHLIEE